MGVNLPAELIEHSVRVGSDLDLVQASGGNTSWKSAGIIWVKGSGKRLKDAASEDIFAQIDFSPLVEDEIISCHDFSKFSLSQISPSIEANFHILLSKAYVTHLHSLGAIALGVSSTPLTSVFPEGNVTFIPYIRPGVELAAAVRSSRNFQENILLLQNHGVIFSGVTIFDIETKIDEFENSVREFLVRLPINLEMPNWIEILTSGVLTPDEAVFLGKTPFLKSEINSTECVTIDSKGEIYFPSTFSNDRIELANFYVRVAKLIERRTEVQYLSQKEVDYLVNWDKEKLRMAMAK